MTTIAQNLKIIRENILRVAKQYHRDPRAITLVAVSKTRGIEEIKIAIDNGQKDFGENRVQEALAKIVALKAYHLMWHYLGHIQSNKAKLIAQNFDWVHSVARRDIAELLNAHRPNDLPPLNICIQINLSAEPSKDGIMPDELAPLATAISSLPRLKLRGLMAIPAPNKNFDEQFQVFKKLATLAQPDQVTPLSGNFPRWGFQRGESRLSPLVVDANSFRVNIEIPKVQDLSMGMSDDYEAAIAAGSTIIRLGTAIFGSRTKEPL